MNRIEKIGILVLICIMGILIYAVLISAETYFPGDYINESINCNDDHGSIDTGCSAGSAKVELPDGTEHLLTLTEKDDNQFAGVWIFSYNISDSPILGDYVFFVNLTNSNDTFGALSFTHTVRSKSIENVSTQIEDFVSEYRENISVVISNLTTSLDLLRSLEVNMTNVIGNLTDINTNVNNIQNDVKQLFDAQASNFSIIRDRIQDIQEAQAGNFTLMFTNHSIIHGAITDITHTPVLDALASNFSAILTNHSIIHGAIIDAYTDMGLNFTTTITSSQIILNAIQSNFTDTFSNQSTIHDFINTVYTDMGLNFTGVDDNSGIFSSIEGNFSNVFTNHSIIHGAISTIYTDMGINFSQIEGHDAVLDALSSNFSQVFVNFSSLDDKLVIINDSITNVETDTNTIITELRNFNTTAIDLLNYQNVTFLLRFDYIDDNLTRIIDVVEDINASGLTVEQNITLYEILGNATEARTDAAQILTDIGVSSGETLKGLINNVFALVNQTKFLIKINAPQAHMEIYERAANIDGFYRFELNTRPNGVVVNPQIFVDVPTLNPDDIRLKDVTGEDVSFSLMRSSGGKSVLNFKMKSATCITEIDLRDDDKCPAVLHELHIKKGVYDNATAPISFFIPSSFGQQSQGFLLTLGAFISPTNPFLGAIAILIISVGVIGMVWFEGDELKTKVRRVKRRRRVRQRQIVVKEHLREVRRRNTQI